MTTASTQQQKAAIMKMTSRDAARPSRFSGNATTASSLQLGVQSRHSHHHTRSLSARSRTATPPTTRLLGFLTTSLVIVPWLCAQGTAAALIESRGIRGAPSASHRGLASPGARRRCEARLGWGGVASEGREECAAVLPASIVEGEGWLVAVHVDRKPAVMDPAAAPGKKRLRGSAPAAPTHRYLPHQYFARAVEATLQSIAAADPGASVDIAVLSDGRWGGLVDEVGVPVDWEVPNEICCDLGLYCTQALVLLDDPSSVPDALECVSVADVFVASESAFSQASVTLSKHVKVLTDRWENEEEEMIVALNPATTVARMSNSERQHLDRTVREYSECSALAQMRAVF